MLSESWRSWQRCALKAAAVTAWTKRMATSQGRSGLLTRCVVGGHCSARQARAPPRPLARNHRRLCRRRQLSHVRWRRAHRLLARLQLVGRRRLLLLRLLLLRPLCRALLPVVGKVGPLALALLLSLLLLLALLLLVLLPPLLPLGWPLITAAAALCLQRGAGGLPRAQPMCEPTQAETAVQWPTHLCTHKHALCRADAATHSRGKQGRCIHTGPQCRAGRLPMLSTSSAPFGSFFTRCALVCCCSAPPPPPSLDRRRRLCSLEPDSVPAGFARPRPRAL